MVDNITIFISYSHDSDEHKKWVCKLGTHLRNHGVDVILDQWNLRIGDDLGFFMEQGLSRSRLVLCVCSEQYVQKANSAAGGVGYEKMILSQALLKHANTNYIIPIVRNNLSNSKIPIYLGSKLYIDFSDDNAYYVKYRELLERIYDQDLAKIPPLGTNPFSTELADRVIAKIKLDENQYSSPEMHGNVKFHYDNNNGVFTIGTGEYSFRTKWSRAGNNSIHAYGTIGYMHGCQEFPEYNDIIDFDFSSSSRTVKKDEVIIWMNSHKHFAAIKILSVKSSNHGYNIDEMEFQYSIYQ